MDLILRFASFRLARYCTRCILLAMNCSPRKPCLRMAGPDKRSRPEIKDVPRLSCPLSELGRLITHLAVNSLRLRSNLKSLLNQRWR